MNMMSPIYTALALLAGTTVTIATPQVTHSKTNVTYQGFSVNGVDRFLNIPFGQDTSGQYRFAPPRPYVPQSGSTIDARTPGPACPQPLGDIVYPLLLSNITAISEDCLNLNIARPAGIHAGAKLPVMIWIHGGSFWLGSNNEVVWSPDGLIEESVANDLPVIHVAVNYRFALLGFTQSEALRKIGSENAGLRDQRLGIEWVRDNINQFGGDPSKVTIFGQSSGGLAVGMQVMAYGGRKPVPFQQAIMQSQALEPGITGNFTRDALQAVVDAVGCNSTSLQSSETITCLRSIDLDTLMNATISTYRSDIGHNIGDIWLPSVDGDFLPDAPSKLITDGRFANVTALIGWADHDVDFFTPTDISTQQDTFNFVKAYLPDMTNSTIVELLTHFPSADFSQDPATNLSAQFYRSARIFRDVLMVCEPIWYGEALSRQGNNVYFYDQNQTILNPILVAAGYPPFGPIHSSEFAYVFGNFSHYRSEGLPLNPSPSDYALLTRESRSWSTFASTGEPSSRTHNTLQGWEPAFSVKGATKIFVIGGDDEGLSDIGDTDGCTNPALGAQKLKERCGFLNRPDIIAQQKF